MHLTHKEFNEMVARNPSLKVHFNPKPNSSKGKGQQKSTKSSGTSKYLNRKVYIFADGFIADKKAVTGHGALVETYDSQKEYQRWLELSLLQRSGQISDLSRQKEFVIQEAFVYHGKKVQGISYKADFVYTRKNGDVVVEDVKGFDEKKQTHFCTRDFAIKWKLLKARYADLYFELF